MLFRSLLLKGVLAGICFPAILTAQSFSSQEIGRFEQEARQVTIIRDNWGIPHIYGKTDADAVFGLMYAQCEEDLKRVERNYLEVLGRLSEVDGIGSLSNDLKMRLIEDSADAIQDYLKSPVWFRRLLDAFADGVNYYLYKHPENQPVLLKRFKPWFPIMFTDGSVSATSTGGIQKAEIQDFYARDSSFAMSYPEKTQNEQETGSNAFVVGPSKTASKNALLYINPHVPFYFRTEVQLVSEEGLDVYGAVTWGQFFVYQGFNAHCGWMHTTSYVDVADLYEEKIKKLGNNYFYQYDGQWKQVRTKSLQISYLKNGVRAPYTFMAFYTGHGPVMASRNNIWISLKENNRTLSALVESWVITKSKSFAEFKNGLDMLSNTTNNTMYADDQGNIAYWHGNFVPKRKPGYDYSLPVDGTTSQTNWQGIHSIDEIVHIYNPPSGWIENCNSTPFTAAGSSSPDQKKYPSYMAPDGQNSRAINAMKLLDQGRGFTLDKLIGVGYDHYLSAFDILLPSLMRAYDQSGKADSLGIQLKEPVEMLKQWDRYSSAASIATTLATAWATKLAHLMAVPKTSEESSDGIGMLHKMVSLSSDKEKLILLGEVKKELEEKFGTWKKPWGEVNRYQRNSGALTETFDDKRPSMPGSMASSRWGCLPSFAVGSSATKLQYGVSGNSFVAAVEFGKKIRARTVLTGGQSNDPSSVHFMDQASLYLDGKFKEVLFYKEDVLQHVEKMYHPGQ
jgi:acyl-homoserine-lactone acylase